MGIESPVLLSSYARCGPERSFAFAHPVGEVAAAAVDEVRPALHAVERAVEQGLHAVGFVCYEAAAGLDPAFTTRPADALPLVYFGLFDKNIQWILDQQSVTVIFEMSTSTGYNQILVVHEQLGL